MVSPSLMEERNAQFRDPFTSAAPETSRPDWLAEYPPPRSLPLDQEALRIYEHAYYIGETTEAEGVTPISFTAVIAALLGGEDETSRWFARMTSENGPNPE